MENKAAIALLNKALDYEIVGKNLQSMWQIISASKDYSQFNLGLKPQDPVYVCIGSTRLDSSKLPNLTYVPNHQVMHKPTGEEVTLFGDTKGHHQDMPGEKRMQELYEYQGYGGMVLDHDSTNTIDFVFAAPLDKVVVPNKCHMTIYNLDSTPLNTADFANPNKGPNYNDANKDLQKGLGPIFCVYLQNNFVVFEVNQNYLNSRNEIAQKYGSGITLPKLNPMDRIIKLDVGKLDELGKRIYNILTKDSTIERFAQVGVNLKPASREVDISGEIVSESLLEIIARQDKILQRHFDM